MRLAKSRLHRGDRGSNSLTTDPKTSQLNNNRDNPGFAAASADMDMPLTYEFM